MSVIADAAMIYEILRFAHLVGLALIAAGLIGVFVNDLRSRQLRDIRLFAEAVRNITVFYDGLVVPGALLLLGSGVWLIVAFYGGWEFLGEPCAPRWQQGPQRKTLSAHGASRCRPSPTFSTCLCFW
jgi:hypothetical protein